MTRVLVAWEDEKFETLGAFAKRVVRQSKTPADRELPIVLSHKTKGNGMFGHYVGVTWTNVRRSGLPSDTGPVDQLVCVVDADEVHRLVPAIPKAPRDAADVAGWHASACNVWQQWLRDRCDPSGPPPSTVHGFVLRWAKESLVLAGYDQPAAAEHLHVDPHTEQAQTLLGEICPIHPTAVPSQLFTDTFRRPLTCLDRLRALQKVRPLQKNALAIDDALNGLMHQSLAIVRARVPDLDALAALIWHLHRSESLS